MRSVLTAIDYIKDIDGSFKVLELNTGISIIPRTIEPYFNKTEFDNLLTQNNITTIDFIALKMGFEDVIDMEVVNGQNEGLGAFLQRTYPNININLILISQENQITPILNDNPNKLIIRQSYDSNALIDETYAKDNFEFLKLLYDNDPNSIPKTYFVHPLLGFDSIGSSIRDNGNYPNFIIKKRYPTTNYETNPIPIKISTQEELTNLKNSISNDLILQEYIINLNDLESGKLKTYRSIGLIYGSNLDSINLFDPFIHTNSCSIDINVDYNNNELETWERPKYLQKYKSKVKLNYNSDSGNLIIKSDNTMVSPESLVLGDSVRSINLYNLPDTDNQHIISSYTETQNNVFTGSTFSNSVIENISSVYRNVWIRNLFLEDGIKFSDVENSEVLILRDGMIKFINFRNINLTDQIVVVNKNDNQFTLKNILSESFIFSKEKIFTIDVEDVDVYLTMDESTPTPNYFIIQHNGPACRCWDTMSLPWTCADPCDGVDGQYTGYNRAECYSIFGVVGDCEFPCCRAVPETSPSIMVTEVQEGCKHCEVPCKAC